MLPGFDDETVIHSGARTVVRRARRKADGLPVILKAAKSEFPTPAQRARLRHEFELLRDLNVPGVARALDLVEGEHGPVLVLEDGGQRALRELIGPRGMALERFFPLASALARSLAGLHQARLMHRDITPSNIVVDERGDQPTLIDFSLAMPLTREPTEARSAEIEGTLAYLAPERTGRMDRSADWRADLYSLGATLYEMLTGRPPVPPAEPAEMIHSIIARPPPPPHELRPGLPPVLSDIVTTLLAKTVEERYQSGLGLAFDLEEAARRFAAAGRIEPFELRAQDSEERFRLPRKLYGRDAPLAQLSAAFERVCQGGVEILMLTGAPGVGKSSLVNEIARSTVAHRGYFLEGKFDQFERDLPLAAVARAVRELIRQLLTESDERLHHWKERIGKAVGQSGALLTSALPELELLLGPQPPVPEVSSEENRNRVNTLSLRLIQALADQNHPLVMFFDDLQWADSGSLELLQRVTLSPDTQYVLVLGAYRDNEVDAHHAVTRVLGGMRSAGRPPEEVRLEALEPAHVLELVSDALRRGGPGSQALAELVFEKTSGNPFFVREMLTALHETGKLRRDARGAWSWELDEIRAEGVTDVVASLMTERLRRLAEDTQQVLQVAACIGSRFDTRTLAVVCERTAEETARLLRPALEAGLVLPLNAPPRPVGGEDGPRGERAEPPTFRFAHDWVQQVAHDLVPAGERGAVHLRIGRLLLDKVADAERELLLLDIARHFDEGIALVEEPGERARLAELYLHAGRRAKRSAAFAAARTWFRKGRDLLAADAWARQYELALALHVEGTEAARIVLDFPEMEALAATVRERARSVQDQVAVYQTIVQYHITQNRPREALVVARELLARLGEPVPAAPSTVSLLLTLFDTLRRVRRVKVENLAALPTMTRPTSIAATRVMTQALSAAYHVSPNLYGVMGCHMVRLALRDGNIAESTWAYMTLAFVLSNVLGNYDEGWRLGSFAIGLMERFGAREMLAKNYASMYAGIHEWRAPWRDCLEPVEHAQHTAIELGDHEFAGSLAQVRAWKVIFIGEPLDVAHRIQVESLALAERIKTEFNALAIRILNKLVLDLRGLPAEHLGVRDDAEGLARLEETKSPGHVFMAWLGKGVKAWLLGDPRDAVACLEQARRHESAMIGSLLWTEATFYQSLALLHCWKQTTLKQRITLRLNRRRLRAWAKQAPFNFEHKRLLVDAEWARLKGRSVEALRLYEQAANAAQANGFTQDTAIAMERAARHQLELGMVRSGRSRLHDAFRAYSSWGATAKARLLEAELAQLSKGVLAQPRAEATMLPGTALDLETLLTASRALSEELALGALTRKLIQLLLQNAGAERGLLVLERDGQLMIEASASIAEGEDASVSVRLEGDARLSAGIVNFVVRTGQSVVLQDAATEGMFTRDPYVLARRPRSVLCAPLLNQQRVVAVVYLENNVASHVFTDDRLEVVRLLLSQAALSIRNARLFANLEDSNRRLEDYSRTLEQKVQERTRDLRDKNEELSQTLQQLRETQNQLVSQEKLASLGALTAGIAHELKNPLNFITNFARISSELTSELSEQVMAQRGRVPAEDAAELDETARLLGGNLRRIHEHGQRANGIISSMLMHSRSSATAHQPTELNKLVADSVNLAVEGMRAGDRGDLRVSSDYDGRIGLVELSPADFRRVLINIINNAFDALRERKAAEHPDYQATLSVVTRDLGEQAEVRITDNGTGIPRHILDKIFDPFFTTKPPGKGSGLGLSLSHDIIVQGHRGELRVETAPGEGTEFIIVLPKRGAGARGREDARAV